MELFLFRHADYERIYNCSGIQIDAIPIERRRFVPASIIIAILCTIYYLLYIPCMCSIWKRRNESTCYLLLFYIGLMDIANLWMPGYLSAWLSLQGAVFCSYPTLIYITGKTLNCFWTAESTADLILGINRCSELIAPRIAKRLFSRWATGVWLALCSVYALYYEFYVKPVLFSGLHFAWFFNPFEGYRADPEGKFDEPMHTFHDASVAIASPLVYIIFLVAYFIKAKKLRSSTTGTAGGGMQISKSEKMMFLQVFLISLMNTLTGTLYMLFQYIPLSQWLITLGEFAWFHVHGLPPIIYLALNQTMRQDCVLLFYKLFRRDQVTKMHGVTVMVKPGDAWANPGRTLATI